MGRERLHTRLDHPEWQHVEALASTMGVDELADAAIPLENLIWRLFNEEPEVRLLSGHPALARLPLRRLPISSGARQVPAGRARGDGRREWRDQRRLRLLLDQVPAAARGFCSATVVI
jgi:hypothetical protein